MDATVVDLDVSTKFTAARARNAGLWRLLEDHPDLQFVQFVDGDCELIPEWLDLARTHLAEHSDLAAVCGRRRERFPERSRYNRLCDLEWDTPIGVTRSCGGDALMRVDALRKVSGFRESLIAGEEPELCFRMRKLGYRIERLDAEMTLHDADVTRISQWFQRSRRTGHAFAERAALHGTDAERPGVRQTASNLFWGLGVPAALLAGGLLVDALLAFAGGVAAYTYLYWKSSRNERGRGTSGTGGTSGRAKADAHFFALACVAGKLPEALGAATYIVNRLLRRQSLLIEYKQAAPKHGDDSGRA